MKLDAFEKIIRKIVREEIEYSMEKLLTNKVKNENIQPTAKTSNTQFKESLSEFRRQLEDNYRDDTPPNNDWQYELERNSEYRDAPAHLKEALTRDYSDLVKKFKK